MHRKPPTNDVLEAEFHKLAKDKLHVLNFKSLSEQIDMSERQIQVWLRNRKVYGMFSCSDLIKMYINIIIFREAYKAGEVLRDWVAVLVLLRPDPVRALVPLGQVLDLEHSRMLVIPGFTHFPAIVPKALIVTSVATSHVTRDN